jgi:hypothetical protein
MGYLWGVQSGAASYNKNLLKPSKMLNNSPEDEPATSILQSDKNGLSPSLELKFLLLYYSLSCSRDHQPHLPADNTNSMSQTLASDSLSKRYPPPLSWSRLIPTNPTLHRHSNEVIVGTGTWTAKNGNQAVIIKLGGTGSRFFTRPDSRKKGEAMADSTKYGNSVVREFEARVSSPG